LNRWLRVQFELYIKQLIPSAEEPLAIGVLLLKVLNKVLFIGHNGIFELNWR
jgi:hypothetical protein